MNEIQRESIRALRVGESVELLVGTLWVRTARIKRIGRSSYSLCLPYHSTRMRFGTRREIEEDLQQVADRGELPYSGGGWA